MLRSECVSIPVTENCSNPMPKRLFLFHQGKAYPRAERLFADKPRSGLQGKIKSLFHMLELRRNPRTLAYMQALAKEAYPDCAPNDICALEEGDDLPDIDWNSIQEIVLLWPDANGTGWRGIERRVLGHRTATTTVTALTGRRRSFALNRWTLLSFRLRRLLEKTFAFELAFVLFFCVASSIVVPYDLLRGRR